MGGGLAAPGQGASEGQANGAERAEGRPAPGGIEYVPAGICGAAGRGSRDALDRMLGASSPWRRSDADEGRRRPRPEAIRPSGRVLLSGDGHWGVVSFPEAGVCFACEREPRAPGLACHGPAVSDDGRLGAVFSGWLYESSELRRRFPDLPPSATESHLLLRLYERHGEELLHLLRGRFVLALWDGRRETLLLARDQTGQRCQCRASESFGRHHALEHGSPLMDPDLLRFLYTLPFALKIDRLRNKVVLRDLWRRRDLRVGRQPKQSGNLAIERLFGERTLRFASEVLSPDRLRAAGIFEPAAVARVLERARRKPGLFPSMTVMALATVELWRAQNLERRRHG